MLMLLLEPMSPNKHALNNIFTTAAFQQQGQLVQLMKGSDKMAATGMRGRSADRLDNEILSQFGRNQAIMAESLLTAQSGFDRRVQGIRREQLSANNRAYDPIAVAPEYGINPPAPTHAARSKWTQLVSWYWFCCC